MLLMVRLVRPGRNLFFYFLIWLYILQALDEDVASPAELAKAFMENRPHKLCPSQLVPRSQVLREESTLLSNRLFSVASPSMSLVPRSSGQVGLAENGFVTPRSKGRTAIYNMARTPYSKFTLTAAQKV